MPLSIVEQTCHNLNASLRSERDLQKIEGVQAIFATEELYLSIFRYICSISKCDFNLTISGVSFSRHLNCELSEHWSLS